MKNILSKVFSFVLMFTMVFSSVGLNVARASVVLPTPPPTPLANPTLSNSCGLKVELILDSSDSMSNENIQTVEDAANDLAGALLPANPVGVIDFDTTMLSSLSPTTSAVSVTTAINSIGHTEDLEFTNWEDALTTANAEVGSGDLVVIITDGNPTAHNGVGSDLGNAITAANAIKAGGTRILAIGITSNGDNGGLDVDNLKAISGPTSSNTITDINTVDVFLGDISELSATLSSLATSLCGGNLTITKQLSNGNQETVTGGAGWHFTVNDVDYVTGENGSVAIPYAENTSNITVSEVVQEGFPFSSVTCSNGTQAAENAPTVTGISVTSQTSVNCTFVNIEPTPEVDVCPNIEGTQTTVPEGMHIDEQSNCVPTVVVVDVCPNIEGDQATVPEGMEINNDGQCVQIVVIDVCPNIDGNQSVLPEGYQLNDGQCVQIPTETVDVCPNIAGNQPVVPEGYKLKAGKCIKNSSGGGSSGGGSSHGGSAPKGEVLGAEDVCNFAIDTYMRKGHKNNADQVKALQSAILNNLMQANLTIDGVYGPKTEAAVRAFQIKYHSDILDPWNITNPTGIFYKTTLVKAKNLICPVTILPIPKDLINWSENPEVSHQ